MTSRIRALLIVVVIAALPMAARATASCGIDYSPFRYCKTPAEIAECRVSAGGRGLCTRLDHERLLDRLRKTPCALTHSDAAEMTIHHFTGKPAGQLYGHAEAAEIVEQNPEWKAWERDKLICPPGACRCRERP
jgi:hypothetical protein